MSQAIAMPDSNEIMQRLIAVSDEKKTVQDLYPRISEMGGRELLPEGVCIGLTLAIYDVYQTGLMANMMHGFIPAWIDALVDDKDFAEEAKGFYQEAVDSANAGEVSIELPEPSLEPPILDERQALAYLKNWMREQGFKEEIRILQGHGKRGDNWEFSVLEPHGMFFVSENGDVEDNYEVLVQKQPEQS